MKKMSFWKALVSVPILAIGAYGGCKSEKPAPTIPPILGLRVTPDPSVLSPAPDAPHTIQYQLSVSGPESNESITTTINFGDGSLDSITETIKTASHTYQNPGKYSMKATSVDSSGARSEKTLDVIVTQQPLLQVNTAAQETVPGTITTEINKPIPVLGVVYDADNEFVPGKQTYDSDGKLVSVTPEVIKVYRNPDVDNNGVETELTVQDNIFQEDLTYTTANRPDSPRKLIYRAVDDEGSETKVEILVDVTDPNNTPPTIDNLVLSATSIQSGGSVDVTFTPNDVDGDSQNLSIDWGDGSAKDTLSSSAGQSVGPQSHIYSTPGSYEVKVEAYDGRDGVTEVSAGSVVVN